MGKKKHVRHNWQRWKRFEMPIGGEMFGRLCQNCPQWEVATSPSARDRMDSAASELNWQDQPFWSFLLSGFRWYRRWCGGKWERWWIDVPVASDIWFQVPEWSTVDRRPDYLCRGTPVQESY